METQLVQPSISRLIRTNSGTSLGYQFSTQSKAQPMTAQSPKTLFPIPLSERSLQRRAQIHADKQALIAKRRADRLAEEQKSVGLK